jgi:hypothetical protein
MKESKNFSDLALFPHIKRFLSPAIVKLLTRRAYYRLVRKNVRTSRSLLLTFIAPGIPQNDSPSAAPEAVSQLTNGCAAAAVGGKCAGFRAKWGLAHFRCLSSSTDRNEKLSWRLQRRIEALIIRKFTSLMIGKFPTYQGEEHEAAFRMNGPEDNTKRFALSSGPFILKGRCHEE